jgi:UDP-glucose 4-epimerase
MGMVVGVTGASGRLGRALLEQLCKLPEVERIVALDRRPTWTTLPKVQTRQIDIRDPQLIEKIRDVEVMVHLAFVVERGGPSQAEIDDINVRGSQHVFEQSRLAGIKHFVYASSIASYGFHPEHVGKVLDESTPIVGNEAFYYTRTKAAVERWLNDWQQLHPEVTVARLRPTVFMGEEGPAKIFQSPIIPYFAHPNIPTHVTHADDVALAFVLAIKQRANGAYNVATEEPVSLDKWPKILRKVGFRIPSTVSKFLSFAYHQGWVQLDPHWHTLAMQYPLVISSQKIRTELGWEPLYNTTESVLRCFAHRPAVRAGLRAQLIFGSAVLLGKSQADLPWEFRCSHSAVPTVGVVNLALTGEHPSEWHLHWQRGLWGLKAGLVRDALATCSATEAVFLRLLSGKLACHDAQEQGLVHFSGEAELFSVVEMLVEQFPSWFVPHGSAWSNLPKGWANQGLAALVPR